MKYIFNWDSLFCTLYIAAVIGVFTNIPIQSDIFDPLAKAFEDFELSDFVFTLPEVDKKNVNTGGHDIEKKSVRKKQDADTNIVLVNIQNLSRAEIAQQIDILNKYKPKVIAIDAFFRKEKGPAQDFPLAFAFSQVENLVLVSGLEKENQETNCFDSVSFSNPMFNEHAVNGFANVIASNEGEGYRTVKEFHPTICQNDTGYPNFSASIVKIYDPEAYDQLMKRSYDKEVINWRGHYDKFYALDYDDVLNEKYDLSFIKGKIVLMGYIGPTLGQRDLVDIFYTPQNHRVAGRSYPDTYGVVVHANIISMILHGNYISQLPDWGTYLIIVILTYLNVSLFLFVAERKKMYYDLITKTLQLVEVMIFMYLIVILMLDFHVKVHLSLLFAAILISGDLTELYAGSLRPMTVKYLTRFGILKPKND
ncbi:MAG: hypothetical protein CL840_02705 [Crocinitomicaceae bacterium]|nr:hypothetical protein [Crocinitomicaceae bacterium]|tara:strand:+ start:9587 stop:10852 length:1266 start_codon:yes stop_codon:yes gene_type:complete